MKKQTNEPGSGRPIGAYEDELHAEDMEGISTGEHGYKYRVLNGIVVPPYVTPQRFELARSIELRSDDICYVSFPKSGSTWLAHIITLIVNNGSAPRDGTLRSHLHWLESSWTYPRSRKELDELPSPRIFKSHMPHHMALGGGPASSAGKYLYIARNPKDVAVSYYYFESGKAWSGHYDGPWEHWLDMLLDGKAQRGDWFDHVLSWWALRDLPNLLFLKYEELLRDFPRQLRRIADFLGYGLDAQTLEKIEHLTSFQVMKKDKFANMHEIEDFQGFFRKGTVASWKELFTVEQNERFDEIIRSRLDPAGLTFEYE